MIIGREYPPEAEKLFPVHTEVAQKLTEISLHQHRIEAFVAGRHRCMCREDCGRPDELERFLKRQVLFLHKQAHAFEGQKPGVSFVDVEECRIDTKRAQGANTTNTQDNFLAYAHVFVAAVEH